MKKLTISSEKLRPALKKLGQAINEKSVLPVTRNIYCKVSANEVELLATDLEITISYKCEAETGGNDGYELLLPYKFLNDVVGLTKDAPIVIEHPSARKARIVCGEDVYELNSLDKVDEFPSLPAHPKKMFIQLDENFVSLITKAALSCGKDEQRPTLSRVLLDLQKEYACIVSTDTSIMFRHMLTVNVEEPQQLQFSTKMIKAIDGMEKPEIYWNSKTVCVKGENLTVWNKLFTDNYPNYKAVIPSYEPTLEVDKNYLVGALHKACLTSNATKQTKMVMDANLPQLELVTDDVDYSRKIDVRIPAKYTGTVPVVNINARKLLTLMEQVKAENVKLHIQFATKAILISTEDDKDYLGLLMPLII